MGKRKGGKAKGDSQPEATGSIVEGPEILVSYPPCLPPHHASSSKFISRGLRCQALYRDLIYAIPDFFTPAECAQWVDYAEQQGFEHNHQTGVGYATRNNGRIGFHGPVVAAQIWTRLRPLLPEAMVSGVQGQPVGCSSNIRLYRYQVNERFGRHVDESCQESDSTWSQFTLLVYLNGSPGDMRGGETVFYKGNSGDKVALSFTPRLGWCLLHGHGHRCLVHEGAAVTAGVKYLLRTDVTFQFD